MASSLHQAVLFCPENSFSAVGMFSQAKIVVTLGSGLATWAYSAISVWSCGSRTWNSVSASELSAVTSMPSSASAGITRAWMASRRALPATVCHVKDRRWPSLA